MLLVEPFLKSMVVVAGPYPLTALVNLSSYKTLRLAASCLLNYGSKMQDETRFVIKEY
jgi:hypothetical protein